MNKEMIKENFDKGLETVREFVKENKRELIVIGGATALTIVGVQKCMKKSRFEGWNDAMMYTKAIRDLGREIIDVTPGPGDFYTTKFSARSLGGRVDNLDLVSKCLADPKLSKEIVGVVVVTKP